MKRQIRPTTVLSILLLASASQWAGMAKAAEPGRITVAIAAEPKDLDPCNIVSSGIGLVLRQNVVETLTTLDPDNSAPKPKLAEKWTQNADGSWRFNLRKDVKFHDGTPLKAEAVKASIERQTRQDLNCSSRTKLPNTKYAITVVDDHTLDIVPSPAEPLLPVFLSFVGITTLPKDAPISRTPNGTGPFSFVKWEPTQSIRFDTNADYWGDKTQLKGVSYLFRKDSALRSAMVDTGEADIALDLARQDSTNPALDQTYFNGETTRIRLVLQPPLNDIRVRKALNLSFDRSALIGTVLNPKVVAASQLMLPKVVGYDKDLKVWPYDQKQARELLKQAKADGVPVDKQIRLIGRAGYFANSEEVLQVMGQMWTEVGFNIKLEMMEHAQWNKIVNKPYDAERPAMMIQEMHDNNNGDAAFTLPFKFRSTGGHAEVSDPKLDALLDKAVQSSGEERAAAFREVGKITYDMITDVVQYHMVSVIKVSPRIDFRPGNKTYSGLLEIGSAKIVAK